MSVSPDVLVDSYANVFPGGSGDSGPGISVAIADAESHGWRLIFGPSTYKTSVGLTFGSVAGARHKGCGGKYGTTRIQAVGGMGFVSEIDGSVAIEGIKFDACKLATYAILINGGGNSTFTDVAATNAVKDGIHLAKYLNADEGSSGITNNNNHISWRECWSTYNGKLWATASLSKRMPIAASVIAPGSVATTAGSAVITGSGTAFTTMGIRPGDLIRLGPNLAVWDYCELRPAIDWPINSTTEYCQIVSVDSDTQLTVGLRRKPSITASVLGYAIGVGDGYHEERSTDNGIAQMSGGLYRGNAGSGQVFASLYGPTGIGCQLDFNAFAAVVVGRMDNASQVHRSTFVGYYTEAVLIAFWLGFVDGFVIINPVFSSGALEYVINSLQATGTFLSPGVNGNLLEIAAAGGTGAYSSIPTHP